MAADLNFFSENMMLRRSKRSSDPPRQRTSAEVEGQLSIKFIDTFIGKSVFWQCLGKNYSQWDISL